MATPSPNNLTSFFELLKRNPPNTMEESFKIRCKKCKLTLEEPLCLINLDARPCDGYKILKEKQEEEKKLIIKKQLEPIYENAELFE